MPLIWVTLVGLVFVTGLVLSITGVSMLIKERRHKRFLEEKRVVTGIQDIVDEPGSFFGKEPDPESLPNALPSAVSSWVGATVPVYHGRHRAPVYMSHQDQLVADTRRRSLFTDTAAYRVMAKTGLLRNEVIKVA